MGDIIGGAKEARDVNGKKLSTEKAFQGSFRSLQITGSGSLTNLANYFYYMVKSKQATVKDYMPQVPVKYRVKPGLPTKKPIRCIILLSSS